MADSMKAFGSKMLGMEEALNVIQMATLTMDPSKMARLMARVYIHGVTEKSMMENGFKVSSMAMEYGEDSTMILT
jgi:hypothetical protein